MTSEPMKKVRKTALTWDEDGIAEHDLTRGTRQKIDEPDTPFASYVDPEKEVDVPEFNLSESSTKSLSINETLKVKKTGEEQEERSDKLGMR
ncbi:hypothetical protein TL16_g06430 [Triparma laevis f. inornata]|uniref:Uncharacterized protein n=2 Tax=Triparma laevis TaxID=1534972 RepID=A0A9W6ZZK8_9STRA|nr:hypothetical protein TrLO_g1581 [Triparma laevis f. longispina]GMH74305.1 hypothetical protein TL16_g06430 [Triparma laevis f. inornata]